MHTLTLELPIAGLPIDADWSPDFPKEARFLLALKLFEQGRVSSGKAGLLCQMARPEFLLAASRAGVPVVVLSDADFKDEFA